MPRTARDQSATGIYHVMIRGINRQDIFEASVWNTSQIYMCAITTKSMDASTLTKDAWHKVSWPRCDMLARQMYKQIPSELQSLFDANRLLIISVSKAVRQSKATALVRNRHICEMADSILFVGVNQKSSLYPLKDMFKDKHINLTAYTMKQM